MNQGVPLDDSDILRESLMQFFEVPSHLERLLDVISGRKKVAVGSNILSLRLLDFFVVNYVRDNAVIVSLGPGVDIDVYKSYQVTQERFRKKCFDPFARGGNVDDWCIGGCRFRSNVRQLCFMRWAIENKVLDYIQDHHKEIEDAMNRESALKKRQPARKRGCRAPSIPDKYLVTRTRSKITVRLRFH